MAATVFLFSCNNNNSKDKPASPKNETPKTESHKGNWSKNDKQEFLQGCMSSALKSYQNRNQPADSNAIIRICTCMGKSLEDKYSYDDANKLNRETIKQETLKAAQNCK